MKTAAVAAVREARAMPGASAKAKFFVYESTVPTLVTNWSCSASIVARRVEAVFRGLAPHLHHAAPEFSNHSKLSSSASLGIAFLPNCEMNSSVRPTTSWRCRSSVTMW